MDKNWTVLHLHSDDSNPYSGLQIDSVTKYQAYINKAVEYGMSAIAFTEHGCVLRNVEKKQHCEKVGLKYIHAEEFYVTEKIDPDNLVRDNYHCCLYAKNYDGVRELNKLSTKAFEPDGHFYYNPRITMDELENTSDNILILTACVGGILCKGNPSIQERFLKFLIKNKHRCWLEIQPHQFDLQVKYNQYLYQLSVKYGLKLIASNDIHALNEDYMEAREKMQISKKMVQNKGKKTLEEASNDSMFENECDLTFKTYKEMLLAFDNQKALPLSVAAKALDETNIFADMIEAYELDYSKKYPRCYGSRAEDEFISRINEGIKKRGIDKFPNYESEYVPRIEEELKTYKYNDAVDFMLLDSDYKRWMLSNGMHYGPSRGSVSGSLIAYLINVTDVDSVKYKLNFQRFMNTERVSLADVDTDIYASDRYKVREYLFGREDLVCCNIVTFNTIQMRGAIKDIARVFGMSPFQAQQLSDMVRTVDGKDTVSDNVRKEYSEIFKYVDIVIGTTVSLGRHAAGIVCSQNDLPADFGLLHISSDPRPVSQIDMHEIDSLNYVKLDLLGLNAVGLVDQACKLAGIDYLTPDNVDFTDEKVIRAMAEDTTLIFQYESGFASELLRKTISKETVKKIREKNEEVSYLDIMAMVNGAVRPAGESFRDDMSEGKYKDNGNDALNEFMKPTLGFLVYQEEIMEFLHLFCGFTMGESDIVRRMFAKKTGTQDAIPVIKNGGKLKGEGRHIDGFIKTMEDKYDLPNNEAEKVVDSFLNVIEDASNYVFSRNHSIPYSMIGFYIAWLRCYYPLELLTAALNIYIGNKDKSVAIKSYIKSRGISIKGIKFGKSRADYFMDKSENTIYQGIESIKDCNASMAEELYELSTKKLYSNFVELLEDIETYTSVGDSKIEILISLGYFSEFGGVKKLLKTLELYSEYHGRKTMSKDKVLAAGIDFDIMRQIANETPKQFNKIDSDALLNIMLSNIKSEPLTLREAIDIQAEYLNNIEIVDKERFNMMSVVTDVNVNYTPVVTLYALANGNSIKVKIAKQDFAAMELKRGDIIRVVNCFRKNKSKKVNGKWVKIDEKEWWVDRYKILKGDEIYSE